MRKKYSKMANTTMGISRITCWKATELEEMHLETIFMREAGRRTGHKAMGCKSWMGNSSFRVSSIAESGMDAANLP
jgi:hypothetical protein